jgi:Flp pilus assembly protein CpaB
MTTTLPAERPTLDRPRGASSAGVVGRRPPRTTGRAAAGALLVTVAAIGTFVAVRSSSGAPDVRYAVAARPVDAGDVLTADDVETVPLDLPPAVAGHAFSDPAALVGATALAPIRAGALVEASQVLVDEAGLTDAASGSPSTELSLQLPRAHAVNGAVDRGEWVDVLATYGNGPDAVTEVVVRDAVVTAVGHEEDATLGDDGGVTLTLRLPDDAAVLRLVHAKDVAVVTLVRATRSGDGAGPDRYEGPAPSDRPAP